MEREIAQAIEDLGGEVFPKLNWSSPRDASWITTTNTLKCHHASDIFLLLKSSDFVAHDLAHAYEDCSDEVEGQKGVRQRPETVQLVLRKWFDLAPSMEFRCFVRDNKLIGNEPGRHYTLETGQKKTKRIFPKPFLVSDDRDLTKRHDIL